MTLCLPEAQIKWHEPAARNNFAEGKPPMWILPFQVSEAASEALQAAEPRQPVVTSALSAFSDGQLIDELMRRGLKSFSFG